MLVQQASEEIALVLLIETALGDIHRENHPL